MHSFKEVKILPYLANDLFKLILDVDSYPKFLPWCSASRIISKTDYDIIAELVVQFKLFTEKYQSQIIPIITEEGYEIKVTAISGPFKFLTSIWKINQLKNGSSVSFFIEFELKSTLLDKVMSMFFKDMAQQMINLFEKRAAFLYTIE